MPSNPRIEAVLLYTERILKTRGYAAKTQRAYLWWIRQFLTYHESFHPKSLGEEHAVRFLEHLAAKRLAPKTRNLAASALGFLFREVRGDDLMKRIPRVRGPRREPSVLSHRAVMRVIRLLEGKYHLIGCLLYGTGMRLGECLSLRVKELDFDLRQILVRDGKGQKDRYAILPDHLRRALREQVGTVDSQRKADLEKGGGWAPLPGSYHKKDPGAGFTLRWQFLFPSSRIGTDPGSGRRGRYRMHPSGMQRAMKTAVKRSGVARTATCHTLRHSFATEMVRGGCDVRKLMRLMGHQDIRVTMHYLHIVEQSGLGVRSPLDRVEDEDEEAGWD